MCCYFLTWLLPIYCSRSLFPACYSFAWFPTCYSLACYSSVVAPSRSSFMWFPTCFVTPHGCSTAWLLLTCYSLKLLPTYYSPSGYTMSLFPACCSLNGCFSLVAFVFLGTSSPPYCCYSLLVAPLMATPRLLVAPSLLLLTCLLVAACHLCFLGWYSFYLIFFLQVVFGAITIKQKPTSKVSFFSKNFTFYLNIFKSFFYNFSIFLTMWYNLFCFDFARKRKKTKKLSQR